MQTESFPEGPFSVKVTIEKLEAAERQLREAIYLFFEKRDAVAIHTLTCAALGIVHDHYDGLGAGKAQMFSHPKTPFIREEFRKKIIADFREPQNFFKHADQDLKNGRNAILFPSKLTEAFILEAIQGLAGLGVDITKVPEYAIFRVYWSVTYPETIPDEFKIYKDKSATFKDTTLEGYKDAIDLCRKTSDWMTKYYLPIEPPVPSTDGMGKG